MKKKIKKKWIILAVVAVVVIAAVTMAFRPKAPVILPVQASALAQTALSNTISTTGVVQSTDSVNVYTDLNYSIKSVRVKVGDHVKAGDVLCQLDTKDLTDSITQKEVSLRLNSATTAQKIKASEKKYNDTKSNLDAGLNTQINTAQSQVDSAKRDLDTALQNQTVAKRKIEEDLNISLMTANASVTSTKAAADSAQKAYDDFKKRKKNDEYPELNDLELADKGRGFREAFESAQHAYDEAQKTLKATKAAADVELLQYQTAVNTAQANYDSAVKAQKATLAAINQDLQNDKNSITSDKISADDTAQRAELASLRTKLAKCTVTAPASGTITAVNAVKDAAANGLLFVIEDTGALKITVKIKEYDISSVKVGMSAIVKSDSISGKEFEGQLQKISPTAAKGTDGKTASSSNAEFEADIVVSSKDTGLLIGMNARAEIVLEKKDSVFAVPFDAVTADAQGKSIVYIAKAQKDGTYKAEALAVTTGIETDTQVEVSGDGLKDGLQIISDSKLVTPGETVTLVSSGTDGAVAAADQKPVEVG